ncbi:MAG: hypothetical protein KGI49_00045 [Patescibacteria group bacterium]|nr:hypothetical protein [Patescibacteria group bacterium]
MIEAATGAVFLLSSLYGAGQANAAAMNAVAPATNNGQATTSGQAVSDTESANEVEAYVRGAYADEPILIDVAFCESTFRQFDKDGAVVRGKVNHGDVGVMQINEYYHADEAKRLGDDLYTLQGNVAFGKYLYQKYGTDPWSSSEKCWSSGDSLARK